MELIAILILLALNEWLVQDNRHNSSG